MNLLLRVLSALLLLPVVLGLIHAGGWFTFGLVLVAGSVCLHEYAGIVQPQDLVARAVFVAIGAGVIAGGCLTEDATQALLLIQAGFLLLAVFFTLRTGDFDSAWPRLAVLAVGIVYVSLATIAIYRLRGLGDVLASPWQRPTWLYVALIATWSNDTFAYFAGRAFGRHKLYEKVSPKKTWEGFAGGALGSVAALFAARAAFGGAFGHFSSTDLLFIGIPAALLAPIGDLAESLLKRNYGVKDSGHSIPGHGGVLDRVDALFFVVPWILFYAVGIRPLLQG